MASSPTWQDFAARYRRYRSLPVWGTMLRVPDNAGHLDPDHVTHIAKRGQKAADRVDKAIARFRQRGGSAWPEEPQRLCDPPNWHRLVAEARLGVDAVRNFFDALIFDRDGYACRYCGRDAFAFFAETGGRRTIWLVVDHLDAGQKARGLFDANNSATACWTCNTIKGPLPEPAFLEELDSLVRSRMMRAERPGA